MGKAQEKQGDAEAFVDELAPGTELLQGQFKIEKFLNSGGFGITYLARDSLDRKVVIKECFPSSFCHRSRAIVQPRSGAHTDELKSVVDLFVQEARSLAKMDHPNIVGVHQVFEDNQTAYMVLDFVEGRDLLDTLEDENHGLTPPQIKGLLTDVLGAVDYIHKQDMLHRDISPDNILVDGDLRPVLIDFGAAREEATKKSRVLSALRVVKDGYSPQEFYIQGSEQSPASDLYALGATFYHLIDGDIPPNSQGRLAAIASGEPDTYSPLADRIKGYDRKFLASIDKALGVLPKDRLQSAQEWMDMMEGKRKSRVMTAPAPMSSAAAASAAAEKTTPKSVMLLGSAAVIAIIAVAGFVGFGSVETTEETTATPETSVPVTSEVDQADETIVAEAGAGDLELTDTDVASTDTAPTEASGLDALGLGELNTADAGASSTADAELPSLDALGLPSLDTADAEAVPSTEAQAPDLGALGLPELNTADAEATPTTEAELPDFGALGLEVDTAEAETETPSIETADIPADSEAEAEAADVEAARLAELEAAEAEAARIAAAEAAEAKAALQAEIAAAEAEAARAAETALLGKIRPSIRDSGASAAFLSDDAAPVVQINLPSFEATDTQSLLNTFGPTVYDDASLNRLVTVLPEAAAQELALELDTSIPSQVTEPAAIDIMGSDGILSAWSVELPFSGLNDSNVISKTATVAPIWARPGVEIVSVNGRNIDKISDISVALRAAGEPADAATQPVTFVIKPADSDTTQQQRLELPILQETVLLNGIGFTSRFDGDVWKTTVSNVPDGISELEVGDELVAFMATSEPLTERTSLTDIIKRELESGASRFSFAVSRAGSMWVASMTYAGGT